MKCHSNLPHARPVGCPRSEEAAGRVTHHIIESTHIRLNLPLCLAIDPKEPLYKGLYQGACIFLDVCTHLSVQYMLWPPLPAWQLAGSLVHAAF